MFYLKQFILCCRKYPARALFFTLFTVLLFLVFLHGSNLQKKFWEYYGENPIYPYFYVLTEHKIEQIDVIRGSLMNLPGVVSVELKTQEEMQSKLSSVVEGLKVDSEMAAFNFNALKISMQENIEAPAMEVVREYAKRSLEDKEVIMTQVFFDKMQQKIYKNNFMIFLKNWGELAILIILFSLWVVAYSLILSPIKKMAYLVENFQRRKYVGIKIISAGFIMIVLLVLLMSCWPYLPSLVGGALMLIFLPLAIIIPFKGSYEYLEKA